MLTDTLDACIIDMKTVREMELASADTKKQADANYAFRQIVQELKTTTVALKTAIDNSEFKPSIPVVNALRSYLAACDKVVSDGAASVSTNEFVRTESKKVISSIANEWSTYYQNTTSNIINLLETVKGIITDSNKATYAINKIKKASNWNTSPDAYESMKQGLKDADSILKSLDLDEDSEILAFLRLVGEGNATVQNLTAEILAWLKKEGIDGKLAISFSV